MTKDIITVVLGIIILFLIFMGFYYISNRPNENIISDENGTTTPPVVEEPEMAKIDNLIEVESPRIGEEISSPLIVEGRARGTWYFEASAPMRLEDSQGNTITQGHVEAQGEWMTEEFVPFRGTIEFTTTAETGTLVLMNDNPSGLPENDRELRIPVRFR